MQLTKTAIVLGTRPEIIKFSPIIRELTRLGQNFFILHTGQHYSYNMDKVFLEQLKLPQPKYNLDVRSGTHAEETGRILIGTEKILVREEPDIVLVEGDTNTALAGALSAAKLDIKVGHVEAGLRSYDRQMPEELNRTLVDHCSDMLFAPTELSKNNLLREGIAEDKISVTGNTIVDSVCQNLKIAKDATPARSVKHLKREAYFLATVHRQENVDNPERFKAILKGLETIHKELGYPVIYPIHPRARKRLKQFQLKTKNIRLISPLDYLSFLNAESKAKLVLTDSGGVQEETCVLHVPCVTLRDNTERPETLEAGSNVLAGTRPETILAKTREMLNRKRGWKNPFGGGKAAKRIIKIVREKVGQT